jgi:hypothetical protein
MNATTRAYVSDVRKHDVLILGLGDPTPGWLAEYDVRRTAGGEHRLAAAGDAQVRLLQLLRDNGVAFAGGAHGWPPAEVFADLRDRGLVHGEFEELVFNRPGSSTVRTR